MCKPPFSEGISTGREPAFILTQPGDDGADFLGRAQSLNRNGSNDLVQHILADGLDHIRRNIAETVFTVMPLLATS